MAQSELCEPQVIKLRAGVVPPIASSEQVLSHVM